MLALAPDLVDMSRAEASPALKQEVPGPLTPSDTTSPNYSRSGSYGDPTLATRAKGEVLLAAMLDDLNEQAAAFIAGKATATSPSKRDQTRALRMRNHQRHSLDRRPPSWWRCVARHAPCVPRRCAIGIHARRSHALRRLRQTAQDRSRGFRRHHPRRVRARRDRVAEGKDSGLGQDVGQGRLDLLRPVSRQLAAAAAGAGRWRARSRRHHMGLSRRRHSRAVRPRFRRG